MQPVAIQSYSIADVRDPLMDKIYAFLELPDQIAATQVCKGFKFSPISLRRQQWKRILSTPQQFETLLSSDQNFYIKNITDKHIIVTDAYYSGPLRILNHQTAQDDFTFVRGDGKLFVRSYQTTTVVQEKGADNQWFLRMIDHATGKEKGRMLFTEDPAIFLHMNEERIIAITLGGIGHSYDATTFERLTKDPFNLNFGMFPKTYSYSRLIGDLLICVHDPKDFSDRFATSYNLQTSKHETLFNVPTNDDEVTSNSKYVYHISNREVKAYPITQNDKGVEIGKQPLTYAFSVFDQMTTLKGNEINVEATVKVHEIHVGENHLVIPYRVGSFYPTVPFSYSLAILDRDLRLVKIIKDSHEERALCDLSLEKVAQYGLNFFAPYQFPKETVERIFLHDGTAFKMVVITTVDESGKSFLKVAKVANENWVRPPIQIGATAKAIAVPEQVAPEPVASLTDHIALQELNSVSIPASSPIAPRRISRIKECLSELLRKVFEALKRLFCWNRS